MRVAVMGSGAWGTVFSQVLVDAGSETVLWSRSSEIANSINTERRNFAYLEDFELPSELVATTEADVALQDADVVVIALPSHAYRDNLQHWASRIPKHAVVVSLAKGIEFGSNLRMTELMHEVAGIEPARLAVLSGPNLSHEIAQRQPTATTIACIDHANATLVQKACANEYFRPYYTTDVVGVEVAGSMKNVIALANGIAAGLGLGENSQASLITRGLHEMTLLGRAMGGRIETFLGLAGVGDVLATSQSPLSRNRGFGLALAKGMTVDEVIGSTRATCEAVKSCLPLYEIGRKYQVDLPITAGVVAVVHRGLSPAELLHRFMQRATKPESVPELS